MFVFLDHVCLSRMLLKLTTVGTSDVLVGSVGGGRGGRGGRGRKKGGKKGVKVEHGVLLGNGIFFAVHCCMIILVC